MYTDIVGYTALTQSDEAQTLAVLERHNRLLRPIFPRFHGREVKAIGDSFLVEFESALDATNCAVEVQKNLHDYNISSRDEWKITLRIGIHLGDVVRSGSDILGDAVNIASRLQPLAEPEGVCISQQVYDQVRNKVPQALVKLEPHDLKGVRFQVDVYKVVMPWEQIAAVDAPAFATNRIAILPFTSFSSDPNDAYFADGVTDEIISAVAGISGLSVISRTSVVGYKGTTKKVKEIGKELEVGSILEGTFKKAGNKIRVTTQLIDVAQDRHLWAQNYDRNLDDVFEVQSDVAKQVADALRVRILSPEKERLEKKPTESTVAYTLYLRGRQLWNKRTLNDTREALSYFERAVKEDPDFAPGYVGQADCYLVSPLVPTEIEAIERARPLVSKALELDPDLAEAHTTKAMVLIGEYDFRRAEEEFNRAIELKPSYATAHQWYMLMVLLPELRWDEALEHIEKAVELDPLAPIMHQNIGFYYFAHRRFAEAEGPFKRAIELGLDAHGMLAIAYGKVRKFDEMKREFAIATELNRGSYPFIELSFAESMAYLEDDRQKARELLPEIEAHLQEAGISAYDLATGYFFIGERDKGFELLEESYAKRESSLRFLTLDWDLDDIREDPRYFDLVKRLGLDKLAGTFAREAPDPS